MSGKYKMGSIKYEIKNNCTLSLSHQGIGVRDGKIKPAV
jgi:hypothetical protein